MMGASVDGIRMAFVFFLLLVAGTLAQQKREGWGWFLFVALLMLP